MKGIVFCVILFTTPVIFGCATAPRLDGSKIRAWSTSLENEYPQEKAIVAHYHAGEYDLYDVAAHHTNKFGTETFNLLEEIFNKPDFNVLLIEPIAYFYGQSPKWLIDEAQKGRKSDFIAGGESSLAVLLATEKGIPFFGGEPEHVEIYRQLKKRGYSDEDVLGFYVVRQVPQMVKRA